MEFLKYIILTIIFIICASIGVLYSKKYKSREEELKEFKRALNIFKTKIKYTYEPIPDIFSEIATNFSGNISNVFRKSSEEMINNNAGESWKIAIDNVYTNLNKEDKDVLKSLSKQLGKTDIDGQVNEIELTDNFLDLQIEKAGKERQKNEKLYKSLGLVIGIGFVIVLI